MNITLHWPQTILLLLVVLSALGKFANHGKQREINAAYVFIDCPLLLWLLYEGGFFG